MTRYPSFILWGGGSVSLLGRQRSDRGVADDQVQRLAARCDRDAVEGADDQGAGAVGLLDLDPEAMSGDDAVAEWRHASSMRCTCKDDVSRDRGPRP